MTSIDWIYWELWHHEGRRARHGASMMGPDYAWWHGMYEVAKHFYSHFLPEVEQILGPARRLTLPARNMCSATLGTAGTRKG